MTDKCNVILRFLNFLYHLVWALCWVRGSRLGWSGPDKLCSSQDLMNSLIHTVLNPAACSPSARPHGPRGTLLLSQDCHGSACHWRPWSQANVPSVCYSHVCPAPNLHLSSICSQIKHIFKEIKNNVSYSEVLKSETMNMNCPWPEQLRLF